MQKTTLAHFTDIHLPIRTAPALGDIVNKRVLGLLSWRRRRQFRHIQSAADRLAADAKALTPDAILISGDITNIALPEEFRDAQRWLDQTFPEQTVCFTPGNHDAYVKLDWQLGLGLFANQMTGRRDGETGNRAAADAGDFPYERIIGDISLIAANSSPPTMPGLASGSLGLAQITRIETMLKDVGDAGRFRLLMIHHPITDGVVSARKGLDDRKALQAAIARSGVELVIHGHTHRSHVNETATPNGSAPVIGGGAASHPEGHGHYAPGRYNLISVEQSGDDWRFEIAIRELVPETNAVRTVETLRFERPRATGS